MIQLVFIQEKKYVHVISQRKALTEFLPRINEHALQFPVLCFKIGKPLKSTDPSPVYPATARSCPQCKIVYNLSANHSTSRCFQGREHKTIERNNRKIVDRICRKWHSI
jgi:hypothetical protein